MYNLQLTEEERKALQRSVIQAIVNRIDDRRTIETYARLAARLATLEAYEPFEQTAEALRDFDQRWEELQKKCSLPFDARAEHDSMVSLICEAYRRNVYLYRDKTQELCRPTEVLEKGLAGEILHPAEWIVSGRSL